MRRLRPQCSPFALPACLALLVVASCTDDFTSPTAPETVSLQAAVTGTTGVGGLNSVIVRETGKVTLSLDGLGYIGATFGRIQVYKPNDAARVRSAYLATSTTGLSCLDAINCRRLANGHVQLQGPGALCCGTGVVWSVADYPSGISSLNYWADVTGAVKPFVDAAPAGTVEFLLREAFTDGTEGEILAVIFDDPSVATENTIILFFGAMTDMGVVDASLVATFDDPIDRSDAALKIDLSLGISFSNQGASTFDDATFVDVNGVRLTSCAGGYNDGGQAPGAFVTVGGLGDSNANPGNPNCDARTVTSSYEDELYDLIPFVDDGDTSLLVEMGNWISAFDDNLYFAAFDIAQTPPPQNTAPTANAGGSYSGSEGSAVAFSSSGSSDSDGTIVGYAWDFGDGSPAGSGATPSHTYADNGTYIVTLTVTDDDGATSSATTTATIANGAPTLATLVGPLDPTRVGTTVTVSGSFTDPGVVDTHTATFDWGDGTSTSETVSGSGGAGSVSGSRAYTTPGVHTVTVTVTDDDGGSDQRVYEFVVVYDPDAGFVTGGGWIDSPAGAYKPDLGLSGRANFGFVSRYKSGATIPSGNTEFQFRAGDLNFKSASYEFLVITQGGTRAQYKGVGTINGSGSYKFMIWAGDGSPDTFRIRIWSESAGVETTVYDNGFDQPLGGGSVVIHRK